MLIRFRCPNGHKLKVSDRYVGNPAVCPACKSRVTIPGRAQTPITDSAVVRLLSDDPPLPESSTRGGTSTTKRLPSGHVNRECPRCQRELPPTARICGHCNLYLFPTENTWKKALRAAKDYLAIRNTGVKR